MRLRRPAAPVLPAIAAVRGVLLVTAGPCAFLVGPCEPTPMTRRSGHAGAVEAH